ncbi:hypothetical protein NLU13_2387 [Sarocladium strictum]|uniref:Cerato-platanin n=1 Tax=Sarocladium strictum TaxID=5046 RepID=A0AA39GU98_SARSR|nr:hypothetical protein NLU13_2387 [Sarocladium strictum]
MYSKLTTLLAASSTVSAATIPIHPRQNPASITPHESYSSSVGVIGCKINTNRVAYWPSAVGCDDICVRVSHEGRSLNLLKIDQSGGAFDISYDAWNYLGFGVPATEDPRTGGGIDMEYETVPAGECADLMDAGGALPLLAANSINYLSACLAGQPDSFVARNYRLYNILDPVCHFGVDELCALDLAVSNQPSCPSGLGSNAPLNIPVWNVQYGTGQLVLA